MRQLILIPAIAFVLAGCTEREATAPSPPDQLGLSEAAATDARGGADVGNPGKGKPLPGYCWFGSFRTRQVTVLRNPSGNMQLSCHFKDLPPIESAQVIRGWYCRINWAGVISNTRRSHWTRSPGGQGRVHCTFNAQR